MNEMDALRWVSTRIRYKDTESYECLRRVIEYMEEEVPTLRISLLDGAREGYDVIGMGKDTWRDIAQEVGNLVRMTDEYREALTYVLSQRLIPRVYEWLVAKDKEMGDTLLWCHLPIGIPLLDVLDRSMNKAEGEAETYVLRSGREYIFLAPDGGRSFGELVDIGDSREGKPFAVIQVRNGATLTIPLQNLFLHNDVMDAVG